MVVGIFFADCSKKVETHPDSGSDPKGIKRRNYWIDAYFYSGSLSISAEGKSIFRLGIGPSSEGFIFVGYEKYKALALAHGENGKKKVPAAWYPQMCVCDLLGIQILSVDNPSAPRDISQLFYVDEIYFRGSRVVVQSGYKFSLLVAMDRNEKKICLADLTSEDYFWFEGRTRVYIDPRVRKQEGIKRIRVVVKREGKGDLVEDYEYED